MTTWLPPAAPAPEPPAPPPPAPSRARVRSRAKRLLGPLFVAGLFVVKFAAKLKALLLLLPKLKVLTTSASMLVSVAAYAVIWGWRFAVGFVALLFVHEMGHVIQMKREGVKISGMLFIPFLGAAVGARSMGGNALAEARIGLAGPVLGTLAAAALIPVAIRPGQRLPARARLHGLLPEPLQPRAGRAARRRPRDGRDGALDVVRRLRRDARASSCCSRTRSSC